MLYWYKRAYCFTTALLLLDRVYRASLGNCAGAQFTCFTGTNVPMLTRMSTPPLPQFGSTEVACCAGTKAPILTRMSAPLGNCAAMLGGAPGAALLLLYYCFTTALLLLCYYFTTTLLLLYYCFTTALLLPLGNCAAMLGGAPGAPRASRKAPKHGKGAPVRQQ